MSTIIFMKVIILLYHSIQDVIYIFSPCWYFKAFGKHPTIKMYICSKQSNKLVWDRSWNKLKKYCVEAYVNDHSKI